MPIVVAVIVALIEGIVFDFQLRGFCFLGGLVLIILGIITISDTFGFGGRFLDGFEKLQQILFAIGMMIFGYFLISI